MCVCVWVLLPGCSSTSPQGGMKPVRFIARHEPEHHEASLSFALRFLLRALVENASFFVAPAVSHAPRIISPPLPPPRSLLSPDTR